MILMIVDTIVPTRDFFVMSRNLRGDFSDKSEENKT